VKLQLSTHALDDVKRLRAFIAKDDRVAARRASKALRESIKHLATHPEMGTELEDKPGVRRWIAANDYDVRYIVIGQTVNILRVWHAKEDRI
jgi:plasmid stabilization system protein ParE